MTRLHEFQNGQWFFGHFGFSGWSNTTLDNEGLFFTLYDMPNRSQPLSDEPTLREIANVLAQHLEDDVQNHKTTSDAIDKLTKSISAIEGGIKSFGNKFLGAIGAIVLVLLGAWSTTYFQNQAAKEALTAKAEQTSKTVAATALDLKDTDTAYREEQRQTNAAMLAALQNIAMRR